VFGTGTGQRSSSALTCLAIETAFIDPDKPWQNGAPESFNGTFRDQHLSLQWFRNRTDAKVSIEEWRRHYNEVRAPIRASST
jgi:IS30 family transposase